MPSNQKQIYNQTFDGGIVTSIAPELRPSNTYEYMLNCSVMASGVGNVGIVTNIKGNTLIETPLPTGENKCIGTAKDQEKNLFYFFVWNSNGYHTIFEYNGLSKNILVVLQSITDTGGFDVLNFSKDYLILMTDIVRNKLLYWVDGLNDARKINIQKALDKSDKGYGLTILEEYINAYKLAPSSAPIASYFSDTSKLINTLYGTLRKFAVRFIYDDGERSNWSDFSSVALPPKEAFTGVNSIPTDNNGISLIVPTGSLIVDYIEIAMWSPTLDVPDPEWRTIATLDKKKQSITSNSTYTYKFYNDSKYPVTDREKIIRPYSFLPKRPLCQAMTEKAMTYWNFPEGFPDVAINTTLTVSYEDLFIDQGLENKFNSPQIIANDIPDSGDYINKYTRDPDQGRYIELNGTITNSTSKKSSNAHTVTIGNDVKKGNIFNYNLRNGNNNYNFSVTATVTDTATTIANKLKAQILSTGLIILRSLGNVAPPEHNIYTNETDGFGNVTFKFVIIDYYDNGYFDSSGTVNPVQFDTLKDTGQSVSNVKLGAGIKFGIMYEDFQGRRSLVYTDDNLIVTTATQNALGGIKAPVFTLTIKHTPPIWAKYYQIVRTVDLTYQNFVQMLIQKKIDVQATNSGGDYVDLVVGSLYTYQKIHPNTTLKYEFKKGDRIRFISKPDGTYYPFYESEILSYKDTTTELMNSNLTVDGSNNVTVASASTDNIGRFILVDGNEREIIDAPTSTTYTVNAPIGKSGQDPYLSYELQDRRGLLRIRKPNASSGVDIQDLSLVEIFTPSLSGDLTGAKQFYHFNKKFSIINAGKENRYHAGNPTDQSATSDAVIRITEGTVYVRNREMPTTNTIPNAQVVIKVVEDPSYSDFYYSLINDNGRENVEDNKQGKFQFIDRARWSNIEIENTAINGLNDFDNLDRNDYNDAFGAFKLVVYTENKVLAFKEQKDLNIPVFATVIQDKSGQELLGASTRLLNDAIYYSHDGGIGNNPESYARNENQHYHASANSGCWVRLSADGITPISEIYYFDNEARRLLSEADKNKTKIFGEFDRLTRGVIWHIEGYDKKTYSQGFSDAGWQVLSDPLPEGQVYTIVTSPLHGTISYSNGNPVYQANAGYVGSDSFTYSTVVNGNTVIKKVCLNIVAPPNRQTSWRQTSAYTCVLDEYGLRTGMKAFPTLEEYYTDNGQNTGNTKPNDAIDPDYVPPVSDEVTCVPQPVDPTPNPFSFAAITGAELSTMYVSEPVTISGINIPVPIAIDNYEYRINGGAWTSEDGSLINGSIVEVRRLSSSSYETTLSTTLTVGGISATFNVTTREESIIPIDPFDFMVLRYSWDSGAGTDLDTFTGLINTGTIYDNDYVGFSQGDTKVPAGSATPYIWWGSDNTGAGVEAILIDIKKFITDFPSTPNPIQVIMNAVWYGTRLTGDITVGVTTYVGGTMSYDAPTFNFVNTGGTVGQDITLPFNVLANNKLHDIANSSPVAILDYDKVTETATLTLQ